MKSFWVLLTFILSTASAGAQPINCAMGYGPNENNLFLVFDDFGGPTYWIPGYVTDGVFFPMRIAGCSKLEVSNGKVTCDSMVAGQVQRMSNENEDADYNGPRAKVSFIKASISGSCRRSDNSPLTLTIEK